MKGDGVIIILRHLIVLHLLLFSVAQMQYPIAHTLVSLIPEALWNMIVKHSVTAQSWSKLKYKTKHARLIRPWSGLWDTTIQNLSLTHSHSSTPDSNPTASLHPLRESLYSNSSSILSLHVFRDKMTRKGVALQFFHLQNTLQFIASKRPFISIFNPTNWYL